jgi:hypothetical protein
MFSTLETNVSTTASPTSMPIPSPPVVLPPNFADPMSMTEGTMNGVKYAAPGKKTSSPPRDPLVDPVVNILSDGRVKNLITNELLGPLVQSIDKIQRGLFMQRTITRPGTIAPKKKGTVPGTVPMKGGQYDEAGNPSYGQPTGYIQPKSKSTVSAKTEILPSVMDTVLSNLAIISARTEPLSELNGKIDTLNNTMMEVRDAFIQSKPSNAEEQWGGRRRRQTKDKRKGRGKTRR